MGGVLLTSGLGVGRSAGRLGRGVGLACVGVLLFVFPAGASADATVTTWSGLTGYVDGLTNGQTETVTLGADIQDDSSSQLTLASGVVLTLDLDGHSLTIDNAPAGDPGIGVPTGASLTIADSAGGGSLSATGGSPSNYDDGGGAGVGGGGGANGVGGGSGSVSVSGGLVSATGATAGNVFAAGGGGAGVGGGGGGNGSDGGGSGSVSVSGGSLSATGGGSYEWGGGGAGVGGGGGGSSGLGGANGVGGVSGSVSVSSGSLSATGGTGGPDGGGGAGVGGGGGGLSGDGGGSGSVSVSAGSLTVSGGAGGGGDGAAPGGYGDDAGGGGGGSGFPAVGGRPPLPAGSPGGFGWVSNAGTMTVPVGASETVPSGSTLMNSGTFDLSATLDGSGTVANTGVILPGSGASVQDTLHGGSLTISTDSFHVGFDVGASSSPAPPDQYVYAPSFASAGQSLPPGPSAPSGLVFAGWYTQASGGTLVVNQTNLPGVFGAGPVSGTLYAQFTPPRPRIARPGIGASYTRGQVVDAQYSCTPALASCSGPVPSGSPIPTQAVGKHTFSVTASDQQGDQITVTHSYTVLAANGSGDLTLTPSKVSASSKHNTLTFAYQAARGGIWHAELTITVPPGWSAPSTTPGTPGYVSSSEGKIQVSGRAIAVSIPILASLHTLSITYGSRAHRGPGAKAPSQTGTQTWSAQEKSLPRGPLTDLNTPPKLAIS